MYYQSIKIEDIEIFYRIGNYETYKPSEDTFLILRNLKKYVRNKVLDMGCGSGILGIYSYRYTKDVTFSDIDEDSILISKINFYINFIEKTDINKAINNLNVVENYAKFVKSNLFENIDEKFDVILFNPPYLPKISNEENKVERWVSGGEIGSEIIEDFLYEAKDHINDNGIILLVFSSLSDPFRIIKKARELGYKYSLIDKEKFFFEELYLYLFRI